MNEDLHTKIGDAWSKVVNEIPGEVESQLHSEYLGIHGVIIIRTLDELLKLIKWLTMTRRDWQAQTIRSGWTVDLDLDGISGQDWEMTVRRMAGIENSI